MEVRLRDNNTNAEGPNDIQSAQNEARIAHEVLSTARRIFNKKIEQITAEHPIAIDQGKIVINSLKSEVNLLTHNAKD